MRVDVSTLTIRVQSCSDFVDGAQAWLDAVLPAVASRLEDDGGRLLRGMVHRRPDGSYRDLVVRDVAADHETQDAAPASTPVPSATAWEWIRKHGESVAVDVFTRTFAPSRGPAQRRPLHTPSPDAFRSREQFLDRETTHLLACPLWDARGRVHGIVSLEASCPARIGEADWLAGLAPELTSLSRLVGPALCALPSARVPVETDPLLPVVGETMAPRIRTLRAFARLQETVLLRGETGVGKSRLARWLWKASRRADAPFIVVDLPTLPEHLQEAELFGWVPGAFTGAEGAREGLVAAAEGGTLFLDEIDKLPTATQAKLLQLLDSRTYRRLGEDHARTADVRFLVGTNADLEAEVAAGRFLEDLYYRICVLPVDIPPLRERLDEVAPWAARFAEDVLARTTGGQPAVTLTDAAIGMLQRQPWPGNLRELHSVILRAATYARLDGDGRHITIDAPQIVAALSSADRSAGATDAPPDTPPPAARPGPVEALAQVARAVVDTAEARSRAGREPPDLDRINALKAAILHEAERRHGLAEAFALFGREKAVASRNHHRMHRREARRLQALHALLADDGPAD